ncbi:MAG: FMN-binding protein [Oscillospiraceae bacterium]|nr:FMN-binding protein [Oscillospiraceae bacterium]
MKSNTFNDLIKPILVLAVICAIASALLAVTNGVTAPVIAENDRITTLNAYLDVLPEGLTAEDLADVEVTTEGVASAVKTPDGCFAIKAAAKGFDGGLVTTILGFDADGNICGIWADCSTQTAGMGSKCADPSFTDQFVGLSGASALTLNVDVQQVSGSTVTSSAFVNAVNSAITCYNEVKGAA